MNYVWGVLGTALGHLEFLFRIVLIYIYIYMEHVLNID